jgi:putative thioredoxin
MSDFAYDVTTADFEQKVLAASHQAPVLVDFWAEWCGPCRTLKPLLEKLATEYGGRFLLAKVNSDQNQELSARYSVRGIPNVKAFHNGQLVDEFTGALPENQVRAFLDRLIPSAAEPLRLAAQQARLDKDFDTARALLADAAEIDAKSEVIRLDLVELEIDAGKVEAARAALSHFEFHAEDKTRLQALQARLNLMAAGGHADPAELERHLATHPEDLAARLQLADALALAQDYRPALEHLLTIVRQDRKWNDEAARRRMLDLFQLMAADAALNPLVRDYRIQLARTLN